jgi:glycosyltransferase involved in cell wall biosynthesis
MITEPLVSIITPCYNREKYIAETLDCLLKLNYSNWECIVMDDASTDKSAEIIKDYTAKDSRIKYYYQSKSLIPVTKNNAINHSNGKYVFPLDSDDLISPNYISEAVDIMEKNQNIKIVSAQGVYFGSRKGKWKLPDYVSFTDLLISNCIHNSSLFRRIDFDQTNGYNPVMFASEEWDLWINILKTGGDVFKIEKNYFFYRQHPESTIKKLGDRGSEMIKLIYENNKELYTDLLSNPILLLIEHRKYKQKYNTIRRLTLREQIP